jgi:hypothetical protein
LVDTAQFEAGLCGVAASVGRDRPQAILVWGQVDAPTGYDPAKHWGTRGYADCLTGLQRETGIPVVDDAVDTVQQGVAIGLGEDQMDSYRRAADLIARIFQGANPETTPSTCWPRSRCT